MQVYWTLRNLYLFDMLAKVTHDNKFGPLEEKKVSSGIWEEGKKIKKTLPRNNKTIAIS